MLKSKGTRSFAALFDRRGKGMEGGLIVSPAPKSCAMIAQKACSFSKYDKEAEAANAKLEIG